MEALLRDIPVFLAFAVVVIVWVWVLTSIISVAQTAKLLLAEQQKTNAILTAVHGLDGANATCSGCGARMTVDPAKIGHTARCQACGKVTKTVAIKATTA